MTSFRNCKILMMIKYAGINLPSNHVLVYVGNGMKFIDVLVILCPVHEMCHRLLLLGLDGGFE